MMIMMTIHFIYIAILECDVVYSGRYVLNFYKNLLSLYFEDGGSRFLRNVYKVLLQFVFRPTNTDICRLLVYFTLHAFRRVQLTLSLLCSAVLPTAVPRKTTCYLRD